MKNMKAIVVALVLAALAVAGSAPFVIYPGGGGTGGETTTQSASFAG